MNCTNNKSTLSLKQQFKLWLEQEQKDDDMIILVGIPDILKRFDRRLAIIKGNQLEKRYLREWREAFRIDRELFGYKN
ncbi:tRNA delta(2)-isopentenylpyrophosphate transferase [Aggregatibacter actinomycetemcomitans]|uniref:tRNA delta(2)-isopentenylpyrophosphate transferase n=1 Tax=Aggregatibacter actinomycetemcomitans TaxID=714 RepID=UPI001E5326E5|nr:tRNA delta(2)-isopentenylpyrophosphate transferase [Aggregatibacter actinomycetemcomitans]